MQYIFLSLSIVQAWSAPTVWFNGDTLPATIGEHAPMAQVPLAVAPKKNSEHALISPSVPAHLVALFVPASRPHQERKSSMPLRPPPNQTSKHSTSQSTKSHATSVHLSSLWLHCSSYSVYSLLSIYITTTASVSNSSCTGINTNIKRHQCERLPWARRQMFRQRRHHVPKDCRKQFKLSIRMIRTLWTDSHDRMEWW